MSLVSYTFAFFLPMVLLLYYLVPVTYQWVVLFLSSLLFCWDGKVSSLFYPMITSVTTWFLAGQIQRLTARSQRRIKEDALDQIEKKMYVQRIKDKQRHLMQLGLTIDLSLLFFFKFRNILSPDKILPLGISYYTFQSMGYLIDVYRRRYGPEKSLAKTFLFVCYFPQLTAGPISRFDQIGQELFADHVFQIQKLRHGGERMLWGYFKKLVIADRMYPFIATITGMPEIYDGAYALVGMLGYGIWLYMDFSGCMDIVIGASQMLGIHLSENFDHPFSAESLREFWRRWHISLMQWFRDYVYFSVSTSRLCRKMVSLVKNAGIRPGEGGAELLFRKKLGDRIPMYLSTIAVWLFTGIWHGVSWNYITWGMANCVVLLVSQEVGSYRRIHPYKGCSAIKGIDIDGYRHLRQVRTFFLFCALSALQYTSFWRILRVPVDLIKDLEPSRLFDERLEGLADCGLHRSDIGVLAISALLFFIVTIIQKRGGVRERLDLWPPTVQYMALFGLALFVLVMGVYGQGYAIGQFVYSQF